MMSSHAPHILLVNPWIHDFAAYDFWAKPLGLLTLGGILREHGAKVSYLDCLDRFHPLAAAPSLPAARCGRGPYLKTPIEKPPGLADIPRTYCRYGILPEWFLQDLKALPPPDLVLITSMMTYWYPGVRETIERIKSVFPDVPVVLGGIYATLCREHAEAHSGADEVTGGPAAGRILDLVAGYTGASLAPRYDLNDLDAQPYPALDLISPNSFAPLLTSLGCPFKCDYCASHFLAGRWAVQSPRRIFREIRHWHTTCGIRDFAFYDDALLVGAHQRIKPLLQQVAAAGLDIRFHTPNAVHIREVTADLARLLYRAGFHTLRLGLETADAAGIKTLDRKASFQEFTRAAAYLREAGFRKEQVGAYLLVGLPDQSLAAIKQGIEAVHRHRVTPIPAYYTPIPHTALWSRAVSVSRYDLAADPIFTNNAVFPCWEEGFAWETVGRIRNWVRNRG